MLAALNVTKFKAEQDADALRVQVEELELVIARHDDKIQEQSDSTESVRKDLNDLQKQHANTLRLHDLVLENKDNELSMIQCALEQANSKSLVLQEKAMNDLQHAKQAKQELDTRDSRVTELQTNIRDLERALHAAHTSRDRMRAELELVKQQTSLSVDQRIVDKETEIQLRDMRLKQVQLEKRELSDLLQTKREENKSLQATLKELRMERGRLGLQALTPAESRKQSDKRRNSLASFSRPPKHNNAALKTPTRKLFSSSKSKTPLSSKPPAGASTHEKSRGKPTDKQTHGRNRSLSAAAAFVTTPNKGKNGPFGSSGTSRTSLKINSGRKSPTGDKNNPKVLLFG